jgi:hypothetical protein
MTKINPNDINYFKSQTTTDPNSGNKTGLYDDVENFDGVIYTIEKEGANLQEDTTFGKNCSSLPVEDKVIAESEKFLARNFTESEIYIPEIDQQHIIQNT